MSHRLPAIAAFIILLFSFPVAASQPEGQVGKMLSNPLVTSTLGGETGGLPGVTCGGFVWFEEIAPLDGPSETMSLSLALIPFRAGPTSVRLYDRQNQRLILFLRFNDGLVGGLPYDRAGWNDLQVDLRFATQDYNLTVNGLHAGPFPFDDTRCTADNPCIDVAVFSVNGDFLQEAIGWIDSFTLSRTAGGVDSLVFRQAFDSCGLFHVAPGGMLVTPPPRRMRTR